MVRQGFCEVETPLLWTPTPEGAREFAVPSRLHRGEFYVLPQSPQIAKQLLMVSGFDRYFQMARCLRDEDLRADRQFEFTPARHRDVVRHPGRRPGTPITEAVVDATEAAVGERPADVERMTWHEAMDRFGIDKPDLRFDMELVDLGDVFAGTEVRAFAAESVKALCVVPRGAALGRNRLDALVERAKQLGAKGLAWFKVVRRRRGARARVAAGEVPDRRRARRAACDAATRPSAGDLVLVVADRWRMACSVLGQLRLELGRPPVGEGERRFLWVTEFPMFEGLDDEGRPVAAAPPLHHAAPRRPRPARRPTRWRCAPQAYDLVLNGWELGSGSIRIHREDIQRRVFDALGITPKRPRPASGSCSGRSATGPRLTAGSPWGSTVWWRCSPARRTSGRSSPSRRPSREPTP